MVLLTAATGIISSIVFYQMRKSDYESKVIQGHNASAALCSNYIRPAMELNSNTLNHFLLKRNLVPYATATVEQRLELAVVPSVINSNKTLAGDIVNELFIYNDTNNVYTVDGIEDFSLYLKKYYNYSNLDIDFFVKLLKKSVNFQTLPPATTSRYYKGQKSTVLPLVSTEYINGYNTVVVTNIDLTQLDNLLKNSLQFANTRYLLLNENDDIIITSHIGFTDYGIDAVEQNFQELKENGSKYIKIGNTSYFATYSPMGDYGWQYYCFTPIFDIISSSNQIIPTTIFTCILLVVLGIFLSFGFTYNIFNPIRNIRGIIEKNLSQDNKNSRSLERLIRTESSIDTLVSSYYDMVNSKKIGFESAVMAAVMENKIACSKQDFTSLLQKNCDFYQPYFSCNVIRFNFNDIFYDEMDEQMQQTVCQALKILITEYTKRVCSSYTFELGDGVFINMLNLKSNEGYDEIKAAFNELINVLNYDDRYYSVAVGIGKIKNESVKIPESYDDAMTAIEYLCTDTKQIGSADEIKISHSINYSLATEKKIMAVFEQGDIKALRNMVSELVNEHTAKLLSWRCMHELLKKIYYSASLQTDNAPNLFDTAQISCTLDEKVAMLLSAYERIMSANENGATGEKVIITAIRQYIDKHYGEDISLQALSDKVGYNYKYVSRVFKEYTGYNISDYINFVRIAKAKELIENSSMTIEEIQNIIGIPSRTTFNRVFKKHEGVPPSQYRQLKAHNRILSSIEPSCGSNDE